MSKHVLKYLLFIILVGLLSLSLIACKTNNDTQNTLKVGATPVPHAELLNLIIPDLEAQGITLEIVEFTDYVTPNLALNDGEIDANFFQHVPYMDSFSETHDLTLVSAGAIHVEPLGLYSETLTSLSDLTEGAVIAIPNDPTNEGRALLLLEANGLIVLDPDAGLEATENDIIENPNGLIFKPLDAAQLPRSLKDVAAAVINTNYALEANLNPSQDAIIIEGSESPYANIITVKPEFLNDDRLKALLEALQSDAVKTYIQETYKGAIVPAF